MLGPGWIDCGSYYINRAPQGTSLWEECRHKRLTSTTFSSAVGCNPWDTRDDLTAHLHGKKKEFTPEQIRNMRRGTETEPILRDWYRWRMGIEVKEVGFAVPKWDHRIGTSVDGDTGDGLVEFKAPRDIYPSARDYVWKKEAGILIERESGADRGFCGKYDHLPQQYYCQILGSMAIMDRSYCDFVAYSAEKREVFLERVFFIREDWEWMYSEMKAYMLSQPDVFSD